MMKNKFIGCDGENLCQEARWTIGIPPESNAEYAWIQTVFHHLSPVGLAALPVANGSMSTQTPNEGAVRKALTEADLADSIVALLGGRKLSNN